VNRRQPGDSQQRQPKNNGEENATDTAKVKTAENEAGQLRKSKETPETQRKKEDSAEQEAHSAPVDGVPSDAPIMPAELLKAVNPVYPPDAMTNYITGDVKAEVEVDASGHVGNVKVISGPGALREAAMAALKQYQYAPATQGGKAVGSKAVEVVKFWFNP
jgi:TonB family protein